MAVIALLTDFGWQDGYVGAMKGVLLARAPGVTLVDVSHALAQGDVIAAAFVLRQIVPWFPPRTVHLVVVDPGVGSARHALALQARGQHFVGPDNGVFSALLGDASLRVHAIQAAPDAQVSPVFHGRDLFAPAAAHLACGGALAALGPALEPRDLVRRSWPAPVLAQGVWHGEVVHVDGFGNLLTSIVLDASPASEGRARIGGRVIRCGRTYTDVEQGALIALRGSSGLLEIACNGGSAAAVLQAGRGAVVRFSALAEP